MLAIEAVMLSKMKTLGFRKKGRSWWRDGCETTQVVNLQKSPYADKLYVNLGVYIARLGPEVNPPVNHCHIQMRFERVTGAENWNEINYLQATTLPNITFVEVLLTDSVAWLDRLSSIDGLKRYVKSQDSRFSLIFADVRHL